MRSVTGGVIYRPMPVGDRPDGMFVYICENKTNIIYYGILQLTNKLILALLTNCYVTSIISVEAATKVVAVAEDGSVECKVFLRKRKVMK